MADINTDRPSVDTPLDKPILIEASAGTGKTYSLMHILLRLIVEKGIPIERILVVTFTNNATYELQSRLRSRLREVYRILESHEQKNKDDTLIYQIDLWRGNIEGRENQRRIEDALIQKRIKDALDNIDNSAVFTIHSFCQRMLKRFAFTSKAPFNIEPGDDDRLITRVIDDLVRIEAKNLLDDEKRYWFLGNTFFSKYLKYLSRLPEEKPKEILDNINFSFRPELSEGAKADLTRSLKKEEFLLDGLNSLRELKKQERVFTFDDILLQMRENLESQTFVDNVRNSYQAVLIDEFQDTDPIQYSIFKKIFLEGANEDRPVIFVGDPKQSIYGFRSADIDCYLAAKTGIDVAQLKTNFRSTPGLVEVANNFFSTGAFRKNGLNYDEPIKPNARCLPLFEKTSDDEFKPVTPFEFWLEEREEHCKAETRHAFEDWKVAEDIAEMLSGKFYLGSPDNKLQAKDIAVLVRKRKYAGGLIQELAKRNIRCSISTEKDVLETKEAKEILYILQAMEDIKNRNAVNTARSTRFFGETLGAIDSDSEARLKALKVLDKANKLFASNGVVASFTWLFTSYKVEERLLKCNSGERELTNYKHVIELLHEQNRRIKTISGLIKWMKNQKETDNDDRDIRRESDDDLVRIVTIHQSKGLEYPVVYILRAGEQIGADRSVIVKGPDEKYSCKVGKDHPTFVLLKDNPKTVEEEVRNAYVAFTRASSRLVIPMFYSRSDGKKSVGKSEGKSEKKKALIDKKGCETAVALILAPNTSVNDKKKIEDELFGFGNKLTDPDLESMVRKYLADGIKESSFKGKVLQEDIRNYKICDPGKIFPISKWDKYEPTTIHETKEVELEICKPADENQRSVSWWQTSFSGLTSNVPWSKNFPLFDEENEEDDNQEGNEQQEQSEGQQEDSVSTQNLPSPEKNSDWDLLRHKPDNMQARDYGTFLHKLIEETDFSWNQEEIYRHVKEKLVKYSVEKEESVEKAPPTNQKTSAEEGIKTSKQSKLDLHATALTQMLENVLQVPLFKDIINDPKFKDIQGLSGLSEFKLCNLSPKEKIHEMDFLIGVGKPGSGKELLAQEIGKLLEDSGYDLYKGLDLSETDMTGYLTGQIDLAFYAGGKFWIIDWKSNFISSKQEDYQRKNLDIPMKKKRYTLQYLLYIVALKRFIESRFGVKDGYEKIGGVLYFFLRGVDKNNPAQGIFFDRPDEQLIEHLDKALREGFIGKKPVADGVKK